MAALQWDGSFGVKSSMRTALTFFMFLFVAASFFSKSVVNISGAFLLVLSLVWICLYDRDFFSRNGYLKYLLWVVGCGAVLAFVSKSGGIAATASYLNNTKFLLIPIPLVLAIKDRRMQWAGYGVLLGSCLLSIVYAFFKYGTIAYGLSNGLITVGRYADQLMVVLLALVVVIADQLKRKSFDAWIRFGLCVLAVLLCFCLVMTSQRGSWLGFVVGFIVFVVLNMKRGKLVLVTGLIILLVGGAFGERFFQEVKSIGDVTVNKSNLTRLHLWATGLHFTLEEPVFGYGGDKIKEEFESFYYSKPKSYQVRYNKAIRLAGNFHNSYLQIVAESGWLYFSLLAGYFFWVAQGIVRSIARGEVPFAVPIQILAVVTPGFLVSQFFHGDLFSYGGVAYMVLLSFGLRSFAFCKEGN